MENNEKKLFEIISGIEGVHHEMAASARERLVGLAKPPGSLGKLEDIAAQMAGITGKLYNDTDKKCVLVFCSDNGVVEEGIASAPQVVTMAQTINFTRGITGVAVLAKKFGSDLMVVDVGVNADLNVPGIIDRKIRKSTWNLAKGHAMTRQEAVQSIEVGIEMVKDAVEKGYKIIGIGEMGIGNTTTSSAVLSGLTGLDVNLTAGKGAGLDDEGYKLKKSIIESAIASHGLDPNDPIDVLAKVGGFDIGAMTGAFIGAAAYRIPVVIDGFISAVAALSAAKLCSKAVDFMIPSHSSVEPGYAHTMKYLGLDPVLMLDMRLGEGSGCPLMFMVVDAANEIIKNMATFEEAAIDMEYLEKISSEESFKI